MNSRFVKILCAFCASVLIAVPSYSAPQEEAPAKPDLTLGYIASVCNRSRKIFLDFDSNSSKLTRASGRDVLETIQSQLRDSPVKDPKTLVYPAKDHPDYQQTITTYNSLWRVDSQLRPAALRLISRMDVCFIPERIQRFSLAFDYLNDEPGLHSALKDYNSVFEAALETIRTMERNDVANFTPDEVLIHSNMENFFSVKGAPKGSFDRQMRAADRYLEMLKPDQLNQFAADLLSVEEALKELQQKTNEINAWLKTRQWSEEPISVAAGYELLGIRVEQTIKSARELLARIDSDSTKAGKIRSGTFIQGGMMDFSDISGAEKGQPQYRIRSRRAFRQVRESYNSAAGRLSERHKNDANFKPLSW